MNCARQTARQVRIANVTERGDVGHETSLEEEPCRATGAKTPEQLRHARDRVLYLRVDTFSDTVRAEVRQSPRDVFKIEQDEDNIGLELCKCALWVEHLV